jgi:hypothetical protein
MSSPAEFRPHFKGTGASVPAAGEMLVTGNGTMLFGHPVSGVVNVSAVITVSDLALIGTNPVLSHPDKIYRYGDDLYRWDGTKRVHLNPGGAMLLCGLYDSSFQNPANVNAWTAYEYDANGEPDTNKPVALSAVILSEINLCG